MARSNQVVAFTQNDDGTQTFKIGDQSITFRPDMVSAANRVRAELHGWKQRISDKAALSRDPKTGKSATPEQKFAAVKAIIDHYEAGGDAWEMARVGGVGGRSEASYIMEALANIQGLSVDDMSERVAQRAEKNGITVDAFLKRVATQSAVATEIARIKHGDADNGDALLDDLMTDDDAEGGDTPNE